MKMTGEKLAGIKAGLTSKRFRIGGYSVAAAIIVVAILIIVNVLAGALPSSVTQIDLTGANIYSISEQTTKLLKSLDEKDEDITIYWIVQKGVEDNTIGTLLGRYEDTSSRIKVEKVDPDQNPTFSQKYTDTITNNSLVVTCGEQSRYVDNSAIYLQDYTNYYTTGTIDTSFSGESAITSAIDYVTAESLPVAYTLTGHGEQELSSDFQTAVQAQNISLSSLSLISEGKVPDDASCVIVISPASDISEDEKIILSEYLADGGNMLLITSPPEDGNSLANLESLPGAYGVSAQPGIVVEGSQSNYAMGQPYYLLPNLETQQITSPLIEGGYYVLLAIAQGLSINEDKPETVTAVSLLSTSDSAYSKAAGYDLTTFEKEDGDTDGPFSLGVAVTAVNSTKSAVTTETAVSDSSNTESKMVWFSSASLIDDSANQQVSGGNQDIFLNSLNWMCGRTSNISISAKSLSDTSYLTIESGTARLLTVLFVGIVPLAVLAAGIVIWVRRRKI